MSDMSATKQDYGSVKAEAVAARLRDRVPAVVTREQAADWAYGNAVMENEAVTREMAERAADERASKR